jgi:hypothetical protein
MSTEDSVNNFIKDMGDLLDSHEISTNPGITNSRLTIDSDENASYDHHFPN